MSCQLCDLVDGDIRTHLYYRNKQIYIVDCLSCGASNPMVVFNHHGEATSEERRLAMAVVGTLFTYESIRKEGRKIPTRVHEHWHIIEAKYHGS